MRDKTKANRVWWQCFHDAGEAFGSLCFPEVIFSGPGNGFKDDKERLAAWKFNFEKFASTLMVEQREAFKNEIERLGRIINGTEAAYQAQEDARTLALVRDTIADLKSRKLWR